MKRSGAGNLRHKQSLTVLFLFTFFGCFFQSAGQKVYFDKAGKSVPESQGYYYRAAADANGIYKSFYVNGGALFFEGKIQNASDLDEDKNVYSGTCKWYYKNGKNKCTRNFNAEGKEEGVSTWYYESGKVWKEIEYAGGLIKNNRYKEFDEAGGMNRIFDEPFQNNNNDWDVYTSDKSACIISGGQMELTSFTKEGASRYISLSTESPDYAMEADINIEKLKEGEKAGIIFGFKDWQNYNYFLITQSSFYIGLVYEGISSANAAGMFSADIIKKGKNTIKILTSGEKAIYSINGEIQFTSEKSRQFGSNIGFALSGKSTVTIDRLIVKEIDLKSATSTMPGNSSDLDVKATGSGIVISKSGYVLTNYHVIDDANKIILEMTSGGNTVVYNAVVVQKDVDNDLAILKIDDASFKPFPAIPYSFKEVGGVDVGAPVFTIGYPLSLSGMGKEAKFTDGKVSAKTGYNNAINAFQTSIPVQPGNSGGPVFTDKGQLVGVINASVEKTDNVSYAIKLNYIKNLMELLPSDTEIPADNSIATLSLEEKIKILSNYVALIKIK